MRIGLFTDTYEPHINGVSTSVAMLKRALEKKNHIVYVVTVNDSAIKYNYDEYLESYILPEVISYYIANAYYRNAMYETTWMQEFNSARDILNITEINEVKVSTEVRKLLRIKYALEVISEDPLDFKKIEY